MYHPDPMFQQRYGVVNPYVVGRQVATYPPHVVGWSPRYRTVQNIPQVAQSTSSLQNPQHYGNNRSFLGKRKRLSDGLLPDAKRKHMGFDDHRDEEHIPCQSSNSDGSNMTESILHYFRNYQQTSEIFKAKQNLRDALFAILKDIFPYSGLYMVGSSVNGFSTRRSDLDMCLMVSPKPINQKKEATELLIIIQKALQKCTFIKGALLIRAKVPILKFMDKISNVECDLNINNSIGIRNTHLLYYYTKIDDRVRPLGLFLKHWARFHDINDASKQTLSSYSLSLMLLHYLQDGCSPAVLPSIQKLKPSVFHSESEIKLLRLDEDPPNFVSRNKSSIGDLFIGFLEYYTNFEFSNYAISVRLGKKLPLTVVRQLNQQGQWNKYINIEEPFDLSNTARSVYDPHQFIKIQRVIVRSHRALFRKKHIDVLFEQPF